MALSDDLGQTTPANQVKVINPVADTCINNNCMFFNFSTNTCAMEECVILNPPAAVHQNIGRKCNICGGTFSTFVGSSDCICPGCISDIRRAIAQSHPEGSCGE